MEGAKHKFNHLLFSPDGSRFIFLHRWTGPKGRETRMYTATPEGKDVRIVDDNGLTSHFMWRDPRHILALSKQRTHGIRFYVFEDGGNRTIEVVGEEAMTSDGHCYLPAECRLDSERHLPASRLPARVPVSHTDATPGLS